jgi:hypothetical protein
VGYPFIEPVCVRRVGSSVCVWYVTTDFYLLCDGSVILRKRKGGREGEKEKGIKKEERRKEEWWNEGYEREEREERKDGCKC